MEVQRCPKCANDPRLKMLPNDPVANYFEREEGDPFVRECRTCGQGYCMSFWQLSVLVAVDSILVGLFHLIPNDWSLFFGITCLFGLFLLQPLMLNAVQRYLPWKPVKASHLHSGWRCFLGGFAVLGCVTGGARLVVFLITGEWSY